MIELKNINIQFDKNIVFHDASFKANDGQLTVVCGKSGSGKSTLIETLLLKYPCDYYLNQNLIIYENRDEYIYHHVGIVYQIPHFFEHLTILEHISFITEQYQLEEYNKEFLHLLNIEDTLEKYPKQLSGGEKTRVSILLSILKDPSILILDEPTASLDKDNKDIVIEFLKRYAHEGHTVIVSTHDQRLKKEADVLYTIKNQKLFKEELTQCFFNAVELKKYPIYKKHFLKYILKSKKHQEYYQKLMQIFVSFSIAFLCFSFFINNFLIENTKSQLQNLSVQELIVHKNPFPDKSYLYEGGGYVMEKSDYDVIKNIKGIKSVEWRYDTCFDPYNDLYIENGDERKIEGRMEILSYQKNKKLRSYTIDEGAVMYIHSYIDNRDYSHCLIQEFSQDQSGVFISERLYQALFGGSDDHHSKQIEFQFPVPIYNSSGIATVYSDTHEGLYAPGNCLTCQYIKVKLPVRGVVKGCSLGAETNCESIYMSQKQILKYYNQYQKKFPNQRTIYWISEYDKKYINTLPDHIQIKADDQVVKQRKWSIENCNAYTVILDDVSYFQKVIKELKDNGYNVENEYVNVQSFVEMQNNTKNIYIAASSAVIIVVLLFYIYLSYINQLENHRINSFFKSLGLSSSLRNRYFFIELLYNMLVVLVLSTIIFVVLKYIIETYNIAFIVLQLEIFVTLFVLSLITQILIPVILKKVIKYD